MITKSNQYVLKVVTENSKFKHIPKIFLTIKGLTEDRINGYKQGCDAYVSKPFDPEELEAIIINLVNNKKNKISWLLNVYTKIKKIRVNFLEKTFLDYKKQINLTSQEHIILKKIKQYKTNPEIAQELQTTKRNVEKHISRILTKTNMNNRFELQQLN